MASLLPEALHYICNGGKSSALKTPNAEGSSAGAGIRNKVAAKSRDGFCKVHSFKRAQVYTQWREVSDHPTKDQVARGLPSTRL